MRNLRQLFVIFLGLGLFALFLWGDRSGPQAALLADEEQDELGRLVGGQPDADDELAREDDVWGVQGLGDVHEVGFGRLAGAEGAVVHLGDQESGNGPANLRP